MRVAVDENTDFESGWTDANVPNMAWNFDQMSLEECEFSDGQYWATYEPMILTKPHSFVYLTDKGEETITIPAGTYGLYNG